MAEIDYRFGNDIEFEEFLEVYRASTLAERRPIDDIAVMEGMLQNSNLVVSAWAGERLVGIARSLTDFCYVAYLSDLAVHCDYQKKGIGRRLIALTRERLGPKAQIVLLAAPAAAEYYSHIGFTHHPRAWTLRPGERFEPNNGE